MANVSRVIVLLDLLQTKNHVDAISALNFNNLLLLDTAWLVSHIQDHKEMVDNAVLILVTTGKNLSVMVPAKIVLITQDHRQMGEVVSLVSAVIDKNF